MRKALKTGFSIRAQHSDHHAFGDLHSRTLRRLWTPNFPLRLFRALLEKITGAIDIREVVLENRVVAASMNFFFCDNAESQISVVDQDLAATAAGRDARPRAATGQAVSLVGVQLSR